SYPQRGSTESAAGDCRAWSSADACGRGRTASRTARGRGCSARLPRASQRFELRSEPFQLVAFGLDHLRRRLVDEALVGELALGPLDLGFELGPLRRHPAPSRSTSSLGRISIAPPGTGTVATGSPPSAVNDTRARRARCSAVSS